MKWSEVCKSSSLEPESYGGFDNQVATSLILTDLLQLNEIDKFDATCWQVATNLSITNVASVGSVFNVTPKVKVLSLPETIREKSTFRAKALRSRRPNSRRRAFARNVDFSFIVSGNERTFTFHVSNLSISSSLLKSGLLQLVETTRSKLQLLTINLQKVYRQLATDLSSTSCRRQQLASRANQWCERILILLVDSKSVTRYQLVFSCVEMTKLNPIQSNNMLPRS